MDSNTETSSNNHDLVTVGNSLIDAFLHIHNANIQVRLIQETNELAFPYGQKILLDGCKFMLGGNASNVAVGVSRLGLKSAIVAEIGDDEFSQKIINSFHAETVDISHLKQMQGKASSFSVGIQFKGDRTLFVEHVKRKHDFVFEEVSTKWMYLTSLGEEWQQAYSNTLAFIRRSGALLVFSPGTLQLQAGFAPLAESLQIAKILFLNKEEGIKLITSVHSDSAVSDMKQLLAGLNALGPKIVVVTDGKNGSFVLDENKKIYHAGIFDSEMVERTGAGDAYASGFLSAVIIGKTIPEAMRWGTFNAASVVGKVGAQPGLLVKEAMEKQLTEHQELQAKEI